MIKVQSRYLLILVVILAGGEIAAAQKTWFMIGAQQCGPRSVKEKPLFDAVTRGDSRRVEEWLKKGGDPNIKDDCGIAAISYAAHMIRPELLKTLIKSGANVNAVDGFSDRTPLLRVIEHFDSSDDRETLYEMTRILIDGGADVNQPDKFEDSPLILAIKAGDEKLTKILLAAGAKVDFRDDEGRTAYSYAAQDGDKALKEILIRNGADRAIGVDEYEKEYGADAFFQAAADGRTDVVEALLAAGTNVNAVNGGGMTALMRAVEDSTVDSLIAAGADVNLKDNAGFSALIWAAAFRRPRQVEKLIAAGADVNARNSDGKTALDFAADPRTENLLIRAGGRKMTASII